MDRRAYTLEQIISRLPMAEVLLSIGDAGVCGSRASKSEKGHPRTLPDGQSRCRYPTGAKSPVIERGTSLAQECLSET